MICFVVWLIYMWLIFMYKLIRVSDYDVFVCVYVIRWSISGD